MQAVQRQLVRGLTWGAWATALVLLTQLIRPVDEGLERVAMAKVARQAPALWANLRRLGEARVKEAWLAIRAQSHQSQGRGLDALAQKSGVVWALQAWPSGRWRLSWAKAWPRHPVAHVEWQGPAWPSKEPAGVPKPHQSSTWLRLAFGPAWPGWRTLDRHLLDPGDFLVVASVADLFPRPPQPALWPAATGLLAPASLGKDRPLGPRRHLAALSKDSFVALAWGPQGALPPLGADSYAQALDQARLSQLLAPFPVAPQEPLVEAQHPEPHRAGLWWWDLAHPLWLRPPEGPSGPEGRAWPNMAFLLSDASLNEALWEVSQHRFLLWWAMIVAMALGLLGSLTRLSPHAAPQALHEAARLGLATLATLLALGVLLAGGSASELWSEVLAWRLSHWVEALELPLGLTWWPHSTWPSFGLALLLLALALPSLRRSWQALALTQGAQFSASALAAGVAHELRTPVAALRVDAELLAQDLAPPEELPSLKARLLRSVQRLEHRLEEVMAFARFSEGHRATTEPYAPKALAEAAIAEAEALLRASGCALTLSGQAPDGPWYGDPAALRRALVELLTNAAKHAPGPLVLELSTKGWALRDHGPGIPPALRRKAFEPFVRGEAKAQGAGLGLALVRATALAHHGQAWAEPAEGGGTRIHLQVRPKG